MYSSPVSFPGPVVPTFCRPVEEDVLRYHLLWLKIRYIFNISDIAKVEIIV